jgi:predicted metal-dependent peptidase
MRMRDAVIDLLIRQPFYGSLATSISIAESADVPAMRMSLSPAPVLQHNLAWYEGLPDSMAKGALLHELLHMLLLHATRRNGRDPLLWAVATDLAVNEHIPKDMLPKDAATIETVGRKVGRALEGGKSAEGYYADLSALLDDTFSLNLKNDAAILTRGDESILIADLQHEEDIARVDQQALQSKMDRLVDGALENGELPRALGGLFDADFMRAQIDWRNAFKRFLTGRGRIQTRATYKRESRRFDAPPGKKRSLGIDVLIALDESGSISDDQLRMFLNELREVNRITNARIQVTEFDMKCTPPRPAEEFRHKTQRSKNGGTDFRPIFELADEMRVSLVVVFTDGEGAAPISVNQRVLWVLTKGGKQPAPFGDCAQFE